MFIPMVGPLVLAGWHVTGFWARGEHDEPAGFPPFDFQYFTKYLERWLWPFVVNLVASLVLVPVMMCLFVPFMLLTGVWDSRHDQTPGAAFVAVFAGFFCLQLLLMLAYQCVVTPLMLRATITQDFAQSFDFGFVKDFLSRVWKELLASMVFMFGVGLILLILTVVTCYIGMFFAAPVAMFSWHHLQKQLYQLYLSRGGQAVPLSPKLRNTPPPLPAA